MANQDQLYGIKQDLNARPYFVVDRPISGVSAGILTYTNFPSKAEFDAWKKKPMLDGSGRLVSEAYETVAEGLSEKDAKKLCEHGNTLEQLVERAKNIAAGIPDPEIAALFSKYEKMNAIIASSDIMPLEN
jgi:hypothetical protein